MLQAIQQTLWNLKDSIQSDLTQSLFHNIAYHLISMNNKKKMLAGCFKSVETFFIILLPRCA